MDDFNQKKELWKFLLHVESMLTSRTDFFIVAQSMFIAAASFLKYGGREDSFFLLISGAGLVVSLFWLIIGVKVYMRIRRVGRKVRTYFEEYANIVNEDPLYRIHSNIIIALMFPLLFVVFWILSFL